MSKKIAVFADQFMDWAGGTDFFLDFIYNLPKKNIYYILLKKKNGIKYFIKYLVSFFLKSIKEKISIKKKNFSLLKKIECKSIKIIHLDCLDPISFCKKEKCNYLFFYPCLKKHKQIKTLGYIADLQHKYLSKFFRDGQIKYRDYINKKILRNSNKIIVNSKQTKRDILNTYDFKKNNIISLPFLPTVNKDFLHCNINVLKKFGISKKYFMISNQFWLHKNYETAFKAFATLLNVNPNIQLVCTGSNQDHRDKNYFKKIINLVDLLKLNNSIKILGHISKNEQISLMKKSIAIIQPTLFEGGPGGGSVKDAVALGVPTIISDIMVNKEIKYKNNFFFRNSDYIDLSLKMQNILKFKFKTLNNKEIIFQSFVNQKKKKKFLNNIIDNL